MEIAPNIHRIEAPLGERFVCMFLLDGDECALLIDTGMDSIPGEYLAPYLDAIGISADKIRYVLISHADFDHMAGNGAVKEMAPNALFMCHHLDQAMVEDIECMIDERYDEFKPDHGMATAAADKEFIRSATRCVSMDMTLSGGEKIRLGKDWEVEILHTPGHTWGHLTVNDARSQTLIIADATLFNAVLQKDGQPAFPPTYRYVDTYLGSMDRFMGMPAKTLLTSHYPVYSGSAIAEFLHESRAYVDRVDQALCDELKGAAAPRTLQELIEALGPRLGEWPEAGNSYLCFPLLGHLERLVHYGRVASGRREGLATYSLKA